jgi:hypothetical protein
MIVIPKTLHCVTISSNDPAPTPWSIDPNRTQELVASDTPDLTPFSSTYHAAVISSNAPSPTPWSIDPNRTQQL